ncbi:MAG: AtpZ/AtpI family protein [Phycisphaerae bacterium]|nr:AtpZ/AtpI family protein [Phycisphaerae bacterium]NUQ46012.1 AtpZ/AtpI family protein [Phycisphaerae bacterium]
MGSEFAGAVCGLTLLGYWIDRHYGTGIKATLIGAAIGVVGGMYNFIRQALALARESEREYRNAHAGKRDDDGTA